MPFQGRSITLNSTIPPAASKRDRVDPGADGDAIHLGGELQNGIVAGDDLADVGEGVVIAEYPYGAGEIHGGQRLALLGTEDNRGVENSVVCLSTPANGGSRHEWPRPGAVVDSAGNSVTRRSCRP